MLLRNKELPSSGVIPVPPWRDGIQISFMKVYSLLLGIVTFLSCANSTDKIRIGDPFDESCPVTSPQIKQAIERGVSFLLNAQNRDGSWGSFESARDELYLGTVASHDAFRQATTALSCMALMVVSDTNTTQASLEKGLQYLVNQEPEGRACGEALYHIWALTYVTQCLARAIRYEYLNLPKEQLVSACHKWSEMLQRMQAADGGWAYYDFGYGLRQPSGWDSTSFNTAVALDAFWETEKSGIEVDARVKPSALKCLQRLRTPDKTYIYGSYLQRFPEIVPNRPKGSLGRAQPCNLMLFRYGKIPVADLKLGLDRLFQEHHFIKMGQNRPYPHESWYATAGYYFLFGHFYAAEVIKELPREEQIYYWKALGRVLLSCQQKDGSWWDYPMFGYHKMYGTAFALLALVPTRDRLE